MTNPPGNEKTYLTKRESLKIIINQLAVYTTYILPSGGLYATYHLLGEPETTIESNINMPAGSGGDMWSLWTGRVVGHSQPTQLEEKQPEQRQHNKTLGWHSIEILIAFETIPI